MTFDTLGKNYVQKWSLLIIPELLIKCELCVLFRLIFLILRIISEFADLQNRVKNYLESSLRDCLKHDWLEDGHTFPLMQYYTDLVWTRMVKEAMGWKGKTMKGLEEILEVPGAGERCLKILVVGEPINVFIF